jgi:hypothetical protein
MSSPPPARNWRSWTPRTTATRRSPNDSSRSSARSTNSHPGLWGSWREELDDGRPLEGSGVLSESRPPRSPPAPLPPDLIALGRIDPCSLVKPSIYRKSGRWQAPSRSHRIVAGPWRPRTRFQSHPVSLARSRPSPRLTARPAGGVQFCPVLPSKSAPPHSLTAPPAGSPPYAGPKGCKRLQEVSSRTPGFPPRRFERWEVPTAPPVRAVGPHPHTHTPAHPLTRSPTHPTSPVSSGRPRNSNATGGVAPDRYFGGRSGVTPMAPGSRSPVWNQVQGNARVARL